MKDLYARFINVWFVARDRAQSSLVCFDLIASIFSNLSFDPLLHDAESKMSDVIRLDHPGAYKLNMFTGYLVEQPSTVTK